MDNQHRKRGLALIGPCKKGVITINAEKIFAAFYSTPNVLTPEIVAYGSIKNRLVYEISRGTGIVNEPLYGVTILEVETGTDRLSIRARRDLSKTFPSLREAFDYTERLKDMPAEAEQVS